MLMWRSTENNHEIQALPHGRPQEIIVGRNRASSLVYISFNAADAAPHFSADRLANHCE